MGRILAYLAESIHDVVPAEDLKPILKHLIDNFVSDRCSEEIICMGLNGLREILIKNWGIIDEFQVNYLAEYTTYKNKNVSSSAKSIVNFFRDVNPMLLEKKHRGYS